MSESSNIYDYLSQTIQKLNQEHQEQIVQEKHQHELRKEKKNKVTKSDQDLIDPFPDYKPPGWKEIGLSYEDIIKEYKTLSNKKFDTLGEEEKDIVRNVRLLKDSYCTKESPLKLANYFIGKFDLDSYYNPYAKTADPRFAIQNIVLLDGSSPEKDGFNIENWPNHCKSIFVNPPFSKSPDAAEICNEVSLRKNKPGIALISNLDYNNYIKKAFDYADICIILSRIGFKAIRGIKISTPMWNNIMLIFNTQNSLNGSMKIKIDNKDFYAIDLKNKNTLDLSQLSLF